MHKYKGCWHSDYSCFSIIVVTDKSLQSNHKLATTVSAVAIHSLVLSKTCIQCSALMSVFSTHNYHLYHHRLQYAQRLYSFIHVLSIQCSQIKLCTIIHTHRYMFTVSQCSHTLYLYIASQVQCSQHSYKLYCSVS